MTTPNKYTYEDIAVGQTAGFEARVTAEMMDSFLMLTGDCNPLHVNQGFALDKGFSGRVVYGMLVSSFYSTLAGVYVPGERCILQSVDIKMKKPVYIGDCLTIKGTVVDKRDSVRVVVIDGRVFNQSGQLVSKARIQAGVLDD